jgi:beta-galactosidase/beta-glucuronidase
MGLNTRYASTLSPSQRALRLDADFQMMQRLGVNTVLGWDEAEFDETLMTLAHKHHLGVILPFDLDQNADYTDPAVRAQATAHVLQRVEAFRNDPALRMWGLGNEVLHKIVHPSWLGQQDPARERNARAFATWLVETADAIHQIDPDHPVTYRDAEDAFVTWLVDAFNQRPGGAPPWFAFGTNGYTFRLKDIIANWPKRGLDVPLWASEFAPAGVAPFERTDGFKRMWGYIREQPDEVLGGAVYAWTRNGPEEIDRALGLTDDGAPFDPSLLAVLRTIYSG